MLALVIGIPVDMIALTISIFEVLEGVIHMNTDIEAAGIGVCGVVDFTGFA